MDKQKGIKQTMLDADNGVAVWGPALQSVDWHIRKTGHLHNDPLSTIRDKIYKNIAINAEDAKALLPVINCNINILGKHDYEMNGDQSANLRQLAMEPLFNLRTELLRIIGE